MDNLLYMKSFEFGKSTAKIWQIYVLVPLFKGYMYLYRGAKAILLFASLTANWLPNDKVESNMWRASKVSPDRAVIWAKTSQTWKLFLTHKSKRNLKLCTSLIVLLTKETESIMVHSLPCFEGFSPKRLSDVSRRRDVKYYYYHYYFCSCHLEWFS